MGAGAAAAESCPCVTARPAGCAACALEEHGRKAAEVRMVNRSRFIGDGLLTEWRIPVCERIREPGRALSGDTHRKSKAATRLTALEMFGKEEILSCNVM